MTDNYAKIVQDNLKQLYNAPQKDLTKDLPCKQEGDQYIFEAFGEKCIITPEKISLGREAHSSILDILISLYALNASSEVCIPVPFRSFKEIPNSMPYIGAFTTHTEQILVPHVETIKSSVGRISEVLNGEASPEGTGGDFSFVVYPLPKIALCYIFYEADDDFSASVTCLYSNNADQFMPVDGLADVGEYTSKKIISLIRL